MFKHCYIEVVRYKEINALVPHYYYVKLQNPQTNLNRNSFYNNLSLLVLLIVKMCTSPPKL